MEASFWTPWKPRCGIKNKAAGLSGRSCSERSTPVAEEPLLNVPLPADPSVFCQQTLGIELDSWQADFIDSLDSRKVLLAARQCGKSTAVAALAVHGILQSADYKVVIVAASARQSALFLDKCKWILHKLGFGRLLRAGVNANSLRLRNGSTIIALPCVAKTIRGFTANLLVIDEAAYVPDVVYGAARPMLTATNGNLVIMSTAGEPLGFFWKAVAGVSGVEWLVVVVPASKITRFDAE